MKYYEYPFSWMKKSTMKQVLSGCVLNHGTKTRGISVDGVFGVKKK